MVEQDLMGYNSGSGYARAFRRCLPCAVGKGGRCGQSNASWLCRRRLDVLDTTALQARSDKTAALNASGTLVAQFLLISAEELLRFRSWSTS